MGFRLRAGFAPAGDQPAAIAALSRILRKRTRATLLGVTGSGKTFAVANVIERLQLPALVLSHNKTLAAQLYQELREFFPHNAVHYFVSYYDYYQPESYLPGRDLYIEKDARVNPRIEAMRNAATAALLSRPDTVIVASVSCIYGLGDPASYRAMSVSLRVGEEMGLQRLVEKLVDAQYARAGAGLEAGQFAVQGDTVEIAMPALDEVLRVSFFGDEIEELVFVHPVTKQKQSEVESVRVFPARHFVFSRERMQRALQGIREELKARLPELGPLEAARLKTRTEYDLEMMEELGYCPGIENYARHFDGRKPGERPRCLLDFFPEDFLLVVDESHVTLPQLRAMHKGDWSRKKNLVDYGFRLPCAFDNRPLTWKEFQPFLRRALFVSATPGDWEVRHSQAVVEMIVRPTGLVDPVLEVRPTRNQVPDLVKEVRKELARKNRVLVTTLTKKMAEELAAYLAKEGIAAHYLHSDIDTLERTEIIRRLRLGDIEVLVGINLLREGLDLPEVGLVGVLDADKEGFLRDTRSLIQTIGRAARNAQGRVILYADNMTASLKATLAETERRRRKQIAYNQKHGITPKTIYKPVPKAQVEVRNAAAVPFMEIPNAIVELEAAMERAAAALKFEEAIRYRDQIKQLKRRLRARA